MAKKDQEQCESLHDFSFADLMLWAKEKYHKSNDTHLNLTFYDWMVYQTPGGVSYGILTLFLKWVDDRFANIFSKRHGMHRNIFVKVNLVKKINVHILKPFAKKSYKICFFFSSVFRSFWPSVNSTF